MGCCNHMKGLCAWNVCQVVLQQRQECYINTIEYILQYRILKFKFTFNYYKVPRHFTLTLAQHTTSKRTSNSWSPWQAPPVEAFTRGAYCRWSLPLVKPSTSEPSASRAFCWWSLPPVEPSIYQWSLPLQSFYLMPCFCDLSINYELT